MGRILVSTYPAVVSPAWSARHTIRNSARTYWTYHDLSRWTHQDRSRWTYHDLSRWTHQGRNPHHWTVTSPMGRILVSTYLAVVGPAWSARCATRNSASSCCGCPPLDPHRTMNPSMGRVPVSTDPTEVTDTWWARRTSTNSAHFWREKCVERKD